jgi:hypothetical protein
MSTVGGVGMPITTEKYIAVVHYEAGDPSATVFAIDDTARQAIAAAKGEEPDDDFVSFPATSALAAQIAEGIALCKVGRWTGIWRGRADA